MPRDERRAAIKEPGGLRHLGALLGRLHALPEVAGAPSHQGGAWHHLTDGSPAWEIAAATACRTSPPRAFRLTTGPTRRP